MNDQKALEGLMKLVRKDRSILSKINEENSAPKPTNEEKKIISKRKTSKM